MSRVDLRRKWAARAPAWTPERCSADLAGEVDRLTEHDATSTYADGPRADRVPGERCRLVLPTPQIRSTWEVVRDDARTALVRCGSWPAPAGSARGARGSSRLTRMSLDPRRLLVLHAVHRHGSVQAAAQRLHLTPSAVSQHLARLEAETGVGLLDRTRLGGGRSIGLTGAGRALARHAEAVAGALADAEQTLSTLRGSPTGAVTVGAFPTAIRRLVAPAVAVLSGTHPGLQPRVVEVSEPAALTDLAAGRLDVAVLELDGDAPERLTTGIVERPLLRDEYRVVVPAAWNGRTDDDVLAGPWVAGPPGSAARAALDRLAAAGAARLSVSHECLEFPAALALVDAGLGAALVPELALSQFEHARAQVHRGALDAGARVLTVAHRAGRNEPTPAAGALLAALRDQAATSRA